MTMLYFSDMFLSGAKMRRKSWEKGLNSTDRIRVSKSNRSSQ